MCIYIYIWPSLWWSPHPLEMVMVPMTSWLSLVDCLCRWQELTFLKLHGPAVTVQACMVCWTVESLRWLPYHIHVYIYIFKILYYVNGISLYYIYIILYMCIIIWWCRFPSSNLDLPSLFIDMLIKSHRPHTHIHTYMHACMHAYIHTYIPMWMQFDWNLMFKSFWI